MTELVGGRSIWMVWVGVHHCGTTVKLLRLVRGRRQAHNPTLTKIMRLTYNRSCSHNRPQTAACNAVYSISRRALLITRLGEQLPRPRQVSMTLIFQEESPEQKSVDTGLWEYRHDGTAPSIWSIFFLTRLISSHLST